MRQGPRRPLEIMALASIEREQLQGEQVAGLGSSSRAGRRRGAFYLEPIWVNNSNPLPKEVVDHNDTFMVGVGARVRIRPTVYLVGEVSRERRDTSRLHAWWVRD